VRDDRRAAPDAEEFVFGHGPPLAQRQRDVEAGGDDREDRRGREQSGALRF
jgi:hypothetical protein